MFYFIFSPSRPLAFPPCVSLRAGNKQRLQLHLLQGSWLLNKAKKLFISEKKKQKGIKGEREGRAVGTGTLSTRASAVRCVKARSSAETSDKKDWHRNTFSFFLSFFWSIKIHNDYFCTQLYVKVITARLICVCVWVYTCECVLLMGLRTEQTGHSFKRHVRRKINWQKIEQQTQQEGFKFNILGFANIIR